MRADKRSRYLSEALFNLVDSEYGLTDHGIALTSAKDVLKKYGRFQTKELRKKCSTTERRLKRMKQTAIG